MKRRNASRQLAASSDIVQFGQCDMRSRRKHGLGCYGYIGALLSRYFADIASHSLQVRETARRPRVEENSAIGATVRLYELNATISIVH